MLHVSSSPELWAKAAHGHFYPATWSCRLSSHCGCSKVPRTLWQLIKMDSSQPVIAACPLISQWTGHDSATLPSTNVPLQLVAGSSGPRVLLLLPLSCRSCLTRQERSSPGWDHIPLSSRFWLFFTMRNLATSSWKPLSGPRPSSGSAEVKNSRSGTRALHACHIGWSHFQNIGTGQGGRTRPWERHSTESGDKFHRKSDAGEQLFSSHHTPHWAENMSIEDADTSLAITGKAHTLSMQPAHESI